MTTASFPNDCTLRCSATPDTEANSGASRMSRRAIVIQIAPAAPPCFATRKGWVEFLVSAAEETRGGRVGPLNMRFGLPRFNYSYDFCQSCLAKHALAMVEVGRCQPAFLRNLQADEAPHALDMVGLT